MGGTYATRVVVTPATCNNGGMTNPADMVERLKDDIIPALANQVRKRIRSAKSSNVERERGGGGIRKTICPQLVTVNRKYSH